MLAFLGSLRNLGGAGTCLMHCLFRRSHLCLLGLVVIGDFGMKSVKYIQKLFLPFAFQGIATWDASGFGLGAGQASPRACLPLLGCTRVHLADLW